MTFPPEVWDGVLRRLKSELAPVSFEMWIPQIAARLDGDCLELHCPTRFHADRVRDFFLNQISQCVRAEFGETLTLRVAVTDEAEPTPEPAAKPGPTATNETARPRARARAAKPRNCDTQPIADALASTMANTLAALELRDTPQVTANTGPAAQPQPHKKIAVPARVHPAPEMAPHRQPSSSNPSRQPRSAAPRRQATFPLTFDSFTVGSCNALAREAAMALAAPPANDTRLGLNQLFIVSDSGLGKTHLARAAASEGARAIGDRARYTTAEAFTSEFTHAVRADKMQGFKRRYRSECEMLVVDDVQFLEGKAATQLEFFHTVQHVLDCGGRVLLTGNRYPQELTHLDERVRARIVSGLVAELEAPDETVRRNILRAKAAHGGIRLPEACIDLLIECVDGNVRELEGALIQLVTVASLFKRPIDLELTRESLDGRSPRLRVLSKPATPGDIIETVAGFFKTSPESLASRSRRRDVLIPRQLSMYLCRRYTNASLTDIGRALNRDHPAVANAIRKIERQLLENVGMRYQVEALIARLNECGHRPLHPAR